MRARVIIPADPIVTPADVAGAHAGDDAGVAALIQAVTEEISGPEGWLGRSLGPQTLLAVADCWSERFRLPYGPVIDVDGVTYLDADGAEQTVDDTLYGVENGVLWFRPAFTAPRLACQPDPVRVQYLAGYDGETVTSGGTGAIPERVRQAIILSAQHLLSLGSVEGLFLRSVEIPDVETRQYIVSEKAGQIIDRTCDRLLSSLRVYW